MKKVLAMFLVAAMMLQNVFGFVCSDVVSADGELENEAESVLTETEGVVSAELLEAFDSNAETYRVMIWMDDIDYDKVEAMAETVTDTTWESLVAYEENVYMEAVSEVALTEVNAGVSPLELKTQDEIMQDSYEAVLTLAADELKIVGAEINEFISAKRDAAKSLYLVNNQELVKNSIVKENVEYISKYSPMVIAELTREQIEELAEEEIVTGIYLAGDDGATCDDIEDVSPGEYSVTATSDYDYYLEYLSADKAHSMGLTGDGVKVGLLDFKRVDSTDDSELTNSNIIPLGSDEGSHVHGIQMARVICGEYGMAPDCELYSVYIGETNASYFAGIELLIDNGVSVVNLSLGATREGKTNYTSEEMWIDHITANHSVVVVVAAGNTKSGTQYVKEPGLAYNTITVANVDCRNDEIYLSSCYINGSDGAQKPDVASAGHNVLNMEGGTSAATATVTGMIAIMLEAKPSLAGYPHIIKAIVIASADHIAGSDVYSTSYNNKQGAGVIDVLRALIIISRGQYWGGYLSADGTYSYTKSVASGSSKSTFVLVGTKMNTASGSHTAGTSSNQDMPSTQLVIYNSSGIGLGGCSMPYSSVQLVRISYNSTVQIRITASGIGNRGLPYAVAWY